MKRKHQATGQAALESLTQNMIRAREQLEELNALIHSSKITADDLIAQEAKISEALEEQERLLNQFEAMKKVLMTAQAGKSETLGPPESPPRQEAEATPTPSGGDGSPKGSGPLIDAANDSAGDSRAVALPTAPTATTAQVPDRSPALEAGGSVTPGAQSSAEIPYSQGTTPSSSPAPLPFSTPPGGPLQRTRPPAPFGLSPALKLQQQDAQIDQLRKQIQELWSAIHQINKQSQGMSRSALPRTIGY